MSTKAAIEDKTLLELSGDHDDLYHLFCSSNPNESRKARCGKTKDRWIVTGSYKANQLCRVCWEMSKQSQCAHCDSITSGGN